MVGAVLGMGPDLSVAELEGCSSVSSSVSSGKGCNTRKLSMNIIMKLTLHYVIRLCCGSPELF